ncbi:MAG: hypothetical protein NW226_17685 [Microscillaceae bacterium]|nr:hypothetical protein [Microscillaceae bacterium]
MNYGIAFELEIMGSDEITKVEKLRALVDNYGGNDIRSIADKVREILGEMYVVGCGGSHIWAVRVCDYNSKLSDDRWAFIGDAEVAESWQKIADRRNQKIEDTLQELMNYATDKLLGNPEQCIFPADIEDALSGHWLWMNLDRTKQRNVIASIHYNLTGILINDDMLLERWKEEDDMHLNAYKRQVAQAQEWLEAMDANRKPAPATKRKAKSKRTHDGNSNAVFHNVSKD